jgi:hypothetical protein
MSNNGGTPVATSSRPSAMPKTLNKEMRELLNAELDRLYKVIDPSNSNQETLKWAMDQITTIQKTILAMATAATVDVSENLNTATEIVRDVTSGT